jgi:hypothetical protein
MATGVIYGEQSGIVRRIVVTDNEASLAGHLAAGEALLILPNGARHDLYSATAAVALATGKRIPSNRCRIVDRGGREWGMIAADPLLDKLDGYDLVPVDDDDRFSG